MSKVAQNTLVVDPATPDYDKNKSSPPPTIGQNTYGTLYSVLTLRLPVAMGTIDHDFEIAYDDVDHRYYNFNYWPDLIGPLEKNHDFLDLLNERPRPAYNPPWNVCITSVKSRNLLRQSVLHKIGSFNYMKQPSGSSN